MWVWDWCLPMNGINFGENRGNGGQSQTRHIASIAGYVSNELEDQSKIMNSLSKFAGKVEQIEGVMGRIREIVIMCRFLNVFLVVVLVVLIIVVGI